MAFQSAVDFPVGSDIQAQAVALVDTNGDGNLDVVTANEDDTLATGGEGSVSVLLGIGDGTLGLPTVFATGSSSQARRPSAGAQVPVRFNEHPHIHGLLVSLAELVVHFARETVEMRQGRWRVSECCNWPGIQVSRDTKYDDPWRHDCTGSCRHHFGSNQFEDRLQ